MEKQKPQSFEHHGRYVPAFHFFVLPVLLVNAVHVLIELRHGISFDSIMRALVGVAILILAFCARTFALTVQDRVIRLEMQLRLAELLSGELKGRIGQFTLEQLVGLRFASDAELPDLARRVLDEKMTDRAAIKKLVKNWRADYLRA
ncbi:MAG: DUF6526 family protein [Candidatus Acidiferrales bacterium]|jgi:hypothetical protein